LDTPTPCAKTATTHPEGDLIAHIKSLVQKIKYQKRRVWSQKDLVVTGLIYLTITPA
jgi:hypothetical protein